LFNQKYLTIEYTAVTATDAVGEEKKLKKSKEKNFLEIEISRKWKKLKILSLMNLRRSSFYALRVSYMDMWEGNFQES
jgi:hypothetical protein